MIFYWLSCPILCLILIGALHFIPKSNLRLNALVFNRYLPYLKNLKGFGWLLLGIAIFFNTVLGLFYLVDIFALKNSSKYSIYWSAGGSTKPLIVFCQIVFWGYILYLVLALVCYKKYWKN